ncbi:unnamed protein product [Macrosiphum euphorbiae]|uniref:Uncharacterized protein n=1 Tax=Macrosiphum euphorbiae TaxID=13131 RepID=A0AAV0WRC2_9HEMI|nr:unnamed protein product [Macrosiphum euphorbiae]
MEHFGKGRWNNRIIGDVFACYRRKHGEVSYHIAQVLTGHGCFGTYLHKYCNQATDACAKCGTTPDTPRTRRVPVGHLAQMADRSLRLPRSGQHNAGKYSSHHAEFNKVMGESQLPLHENYDMLRTRGTKGEARRSMNQQTGHNRNTRLRDWLACDAGS